MTDKPLYERMKSEGLSKSDLYQTPPHALDPLCKYIPEEYIIWEPACGKGNLVRGLSERGFWVIGTDKEDLDFLRAVNPLPFKADMILTNPPYSLKDEFIEKCYELGKPFALLMKITALEGQKRQKMYRENGLQLIVPNRRINYETPNGNGKSGAWFLSMWFTYGLDLPSDLIFEELSNEV